METVLARLKTYDKRRGYVLRCFTYRGIKFLAERGWIRVTMAVGDYLRTVRSEPRDPHSPLAFDVCTDEEARSMEAAEARDAATRQNATSDLKLTTARGERAGERVAPERAAPPADRAAPAPDRAPLADRADRAAADATSAPAPAASAGEPADQPGARDAKSRRERGG